MSQTVRQNLCILGSRNVDSTTKNIFCLIDRTVLFLSLLLAFLFQTALNIEMAAKTYWYFPNNDILHS